MMLLLKANASQFVKASRCAKRYGTAGSDQGPQSNVWTQSFKAGGWLVGERGGQGRPVGLSVGARMDGWHQGEWVGARVQSCQGVLRSRQGEA